MVPPRLGANRRKSLCLQQQQANGDREHERGGGGGNGPFDQDTEEAEDGEDDHHHIDTALHTSSDAKPLDHAHNNWILHPFPTRVTQVAPASLSGPLPPRTADPGHALPDAAHAPLKAAKPPKRHQPHHDDGWNEGATLALLQAWGSKFLELDHGCLSRQDWAHIVQHVSLSGKTSKTDTQCRNRIDTLKKKYKREKHKQATMGGSCSSWPYYKHMDAFLNTAPKPACPPCAVNAGHAIDVGRDGKLGQDTLNNIVLAGTDPCLWRNGNHGQDAPNIASASCELHDSSEMSQSSPSLSDNEHDEHHKAKKQRFEKAPFWALAKAIESFAEIYEKIETAKQQQALDLEKTRMEVTRNFELQKWRLLLQTQMELAKIKEATDDVDPSVGDMSTRLFATCFMPLEYCL